MQSDDTSSKPEKLHTIREAADYVGAKDWQIRRAIGRGLIPYFAPFNSRRLVRLSDVLALVEGSRKGGNDDGL